MTLVSVLPATKSEFAHAIDWAAREGWNPGIGDLDAFYPSDPQGFLIGWSDGEPVSSISVVRYGGGFGFLGFYMVTPDMRELGIGLATWNAGMEHLGDRVIGLDGVVAQQHNYRKSGFVLYGRNIRHTGVPRHGGGTMEPGVSVVSLGAEILEPVVAYDAMHFPGDRSQFIREWVHPTTEASGRHTLVALADGVIAGFGTVRQCREGFKIGPLTAENERVARALFDALCKVLPADVAVSLDTPEANKPAIAIAADAGLQPVFETARMYRGPVPALPLGRIFGITTFELG